MFARRVRGLPSQGRLCRYVSAVLLLVLLSILSDGATAGKTVQEKLDAHRFPKLWNDLELGGLEDLTWTYYDQCSPPQPGADLDLIPWWDIISLDVEVMENSPAKLAEMRLANPDLVVLSYWGAVLWSTSDQSCSGWNEIRCSFGTRIEDDWYVYDSQGSRVFAFSNYLCSSYLMDIRSDWQTEVPSFLHTDVLSSDLWDGIFFDWIEDAVCWCADDIDLDRDGTPDACSTVDSVFLTGRQAMLDACRVLEGNGTLLIGNGGWCGTTAVYSSALNGMLIEDFAYAVDWPGPLERVRQMLEDGVPPEVCALLSTGRHDNYQELRYGLCSALMLGCYFAYDGHQNCDVGGAPAPCGHHATWWYDEYSINASGWPTGDASSKGYLGDPLGPAYAAGNPSILLETALETGTPQADTVAWRRDFEHGVALVNPSDSPELVILGGTYYRFHGIQDPVTNDGAAVTQMTVPARDGLILLSDIVPASNQPPTGCAGPDQYVEVGPILFADGFEDGDAAGWEKDPASAWSVIDDGGSKVYRGVPPVLGQEATETWVQATWGDAIYQTRIKLVDDEHAGINFRAYSCGQYAVWIGHGDFALTRHIWCEDDWQVLGEAGLDSDTWHNVWTVIDGTKIQVFVDGELKVEAHDPAPLPSGTIQYFAKNTEIYLDDIVVAKPVFLNGSSSTDPNCAIGDVLSYQWEFLMKPGSSQASLSDPNTMNPVFVADVAGVYHLRLTVTDAAGEADTDSVRIYAGVDSAAVYKATAEGDVRADGTFHANEFLSGSADVAEWVHVSEFAAPGDLIVLDPACPDMYSPSQRPCSSLIAGVISSYPGVTLGHDSKTDAQALLALVGIVPVKVTNEGGPIQPGDLLVSSSTPGHAMRWSGPDPCPCSLVGKALEPMTEKEGLVLVLLTAH